MSEKQNQADSEKKVLHFSASGALTPHRSLGSTLKKRLWIVENAKKVNNLKNIFPEDEVCSTRGIPFEIAVDVAPTNKGKPHIDFKVLFSKKEEKLKKEILGYAETCGCIFLATDPTTRGEAIAQGFAEHFPELANKFVRIPLTNFSREDLQKTALFQQNLPPHRRTKPNKNKADAYWTQAVMDLTWKNKVTPWVSAALLLVQRLHASKGLAPAKEVDSLTRLQCAILHFINQEEQTAKGYRSFEYWELHCILRGTIPGTSIEASVSVPTMAQMVAGKSRLTEKIWREKIEKNNLALQNGTSVPQANPGNPWRFDTQDEAALYRQNLKTQPFFVADEPQLSSYEAETDPPHTFFSLLRLSTEENWGSQKDVGEVLEELFYGGLITYPKTNNPNFSEEGFQRLRRFTAKVDMEVPPTRREFPAELETTKSECIQPTIWEITPELANTEIGKSVRGRTGLAIKIYHSIYERALKSQLPPNPKTSLRLALVGPLPATRETVQSGNPIPQESPIDSQMNVILSAQREITGQEEPLLSLYEGVLMEVIKPNIVLKKSTAPSPLTRESITLTMLRENLGQLTTLLSYIPTLLDAELIQETEGKIHLTKSGQVIIRLLHEYLGKFIHNNYHQTMEIQLQQIEIGKQNCRDFLGYWWGKLCESADKLPPIPNAVAECSGESLRTLEMLYHRDYETPAQNIHMAS